ncbi:hypothetical protein Gpo141_00007153 [Globisporangium polare]
MSSSIPKPRTASFVTTHSPTTINVPLDSRVVLSKRRSGWVRYIGKIKNEAGEWYGIALNEGKGENDGTWEKERYFDCPPHHGVFVRRKEIFCVKEYPVSRSSKGPPSPVMHDNSDAGSSTGSSVDSQDTPPPPPSSGHSSMRSGSLAPPAPATASSMTQQAASVITPLIRTFKSFRKELGLQISPSKTSNNNSNSPNGTSTASPKSSTVASSSRSSGLRSPSSTRFASFASASPTSRTASIVSQMMVTPVGVPSEEGSTVAMQPTSQNEPLSYQQPHEREDQQQKQKLQKQQSLTDLMDGNGGISSLSDLYSGAADEELRAAAEPFTSPPSSRTSSQSTRVSSFSSTTAVEAMKPSKNAEPAPAPLFFRRANIGSPTLGRRASFSMTNGGASSPVSSLGKMSPTHLAATTRMAELEKEINVMKTNHENIVAVLRATNKQHAANVLELRAQVAALTEGNQWLEKQLASKSALIAELHAMESSDDRVPRAEVENIIAIKDAQIQTLEREIAKLKQHMLRLETEKDSILCQQVKHFRLRQESDEARIHKLREDVLAMCNERTSLQSELQDLKEMTFLF